MADPSGYVVRLGDVDTLAFPWGTLHFTCSPLVNGANRLSAGIVVMKPGEGHGRHNHPGTEEIIQVLSGSGKQMVEDEHGNPILHDVEQGCTIFVPEGRFHSTANTGASEMVVFVVYSPAGPEQMLRSLPDCKILPAAP